LLLLLLFNSLLLSPETFGYTRAAYLSPHKLHFPTLILFPSHLHTLEASLT